MEARFYRTCSRTYLMLNIDALDEATRRFPIANLVVVCE